MIFHGSEIWEMLHCIFINSLQDGYDMLIFYIAVFCCSKKILKGSTIGGCFIQKFVNFMINMSAFGSKILKMLYCTFGKFLPDRIRWFHFVTNASVTSQTGEEGLAIRICRRRLSIFGHVQRLPEATPAHSTLRLAVDTRAGGKPYIRPEWKRQRG